MTNTELAMYYCPHCMMHYPQNAEEYAKEIKEMLKTKQGRDKLKELRDDYEAFLERRQND